MANKKQVHEFALRWADKFRDQKIHYMELVDHHMADDCALLGFKMDCGQAFAERYGQAASNYEELDKIIHEVTDIDLLGSAVYSRWRYFNHWAYSGAEILEFENRSWFLLALERLAVLTDDTPLKIQGKREHTVPSVPVCRDPGISASNVSDENNKPDMVNRITVNYYHVTRRKPKYPINAAEEYVTWEYCESFIIDRKTKTIEHTQDIGTECTITQKYKVENRVENLLDALEAKYLFTHTEGNPPDVVENPNESRDYTIVIEFKDSPKKVIQGSFDKRGLPDDWAIFATTVSKFMRSFGQGEIFNPSVYSSLKRRKDDIIYCSVIFEDGSRSYYYIADDDSIEVGDFVLVPAGTDNHLAIVNVVKIEHFSREDVPFPVEKTKHIIRKCTEEDFLNLLL